MTNSYKAHFATELQAARYDGDEYADGSYGQMLWDLEKAVLRTFVQEFRQTHPQIRYLDFASGTGRIAGFMEGLVETATSIEISESMAARARARLRATNVLCRDITTSDSEPEGKYDLITAFRFFLNAEPGLRLPAIKALAARLRDDDSRLVFNNHGNLWSLKLIGWPGHKLRNFRRGWKPYGNYMSHSDVKRLLAQAGLRIVSVTGLGVLGGKVFSRLPFERGSKFERRLAASFLSEFGQDQIYVACRQTENANVAQRPFAHHRLSRTAES